MKTCTLVTLSCVGLALINDGAKFLVKSTRNDIKVPELSKDAKGTLSVCPCEVQKYFLLKLVEY